MSGSLATRSTTSVAACFAATWCAVGVVPVFTPLHVQAAEVQAPVMGPFVKSSRSVDDLVAALDSTSLQARTLADRELSHSSDATLRSLIERLARPDLSPEQLTRLTRIAWERFEKSPRAALGISFQRSFLGGAESGAVIEATIPGFDSVRVLKPGDTIYSMGGVRIRSMDDGKRVIQSYEPGERVSLHVFRDGQPILVRVTLGSMDGLTTAQPAVPQTREPMVVRDAFRMRVSRDLGDTQQRDGVELNLTKFWKGVETLQDIEARENPGPAFQARPPRRASDEGEKLDERPTALSAGGVQAPISSAHFGRFAASTTALLNRVRELEADLYKIDIQLANQDRIIDDPNTGADRRDRAERDRKLLLEKRQKLKGLLSDLESGGMTH